MPVRRTESRIPAQLQASDLGQAIVAGDARCALVSFVTSPLVVERDNVYVLFVTDAALAAAAQSFEWSFAIEGGAPAVQTTAFGEAVFRPPSSGRLSVAVRILGTGGAEQARLSLAQDVVAPNAELETMIANARNEQGPAVGNPAVARELINEHNPYYQDAAPSVPEAGEGFARLLFTMAYDGALERPAAERTRHLGRVAAVLNGEEGDFAALAAQALGVCAIRLPLAAMTTTQAGGAVPVLPWTELPEAPAPRSSTDAELRRTLAALDPDIRTDLFNRVRFPKSNIRQCGRILEALRDRYFPGNRFDDVLTGLGGTRAHWISRHYREGPLDAA